MTAARILIAKCVLSVNIIVKLLFRIDLIRDVSRINNLAIYLSIRKKFERGSGIASSESDRALKGPR